MQRANMARKVASRFLSGDVEGEPIKKFLPSPKKKPPRRRPMVENKSNRSDYMKEYMTEYRGEGKDYQKVPR